MSLAFINSTCLSFFILLNASLASSTILVTSSFPDIALLKAAEALPPFCPAAKAAPMASALVPCSLASVFLARKPLGILTAFVAAVIGSILLKVDNVPAKALLFGANMAPPDKIIDTSLSNATGSVAKVFLILSNPPYRSLK